MMGRASFPHGPWQRSSRSRPDGVPPHVFAGELEARVDVVWADPDRQVPVALIDRDGCYALVRTAHADELSGWSDAVAAIERNSYVHVDTKAAVRAMLTALEVEADAS